MAALASNDFADEIEYLKLHSCYYEKCVFQQTKVLDRKNFFPGNCVPETPNYTRLALASLPIHFLDRSANLEHGKNFVKEQIDGFPTLPYMNDETNRKTGERRNFDLHWKAPRDTKQ